MTLSLGLSYCPRPKTKESRGFSISLMTMTVGNSEIELVLPRFKAHPFGMFRTQGLWRGIGKEVVA